MDDTAFCTRCSKVKPRRHFSPSQVRKNGRGWCRLCHNEVRNETRSGRRRTIKLHYVCQLPGCAADISHLGWNAKWCSKSHALKGWHLANPRSRRQHWIKCVYGLAGEQFDQLLAEQGGRCAVCLKVPNTESGQKWDQWNVDHCHDSGAVRGLLCGACNVGIGQLRDDPDRVRAAIAYVQSAKPLLDARGSEGVLVVDIGLESAAETRHCSRCDRHLTQESFAPSIWAKSKKRAWCTGCYTGWTKNHRAGVPPTSRSRRTCEAPGCTVDISHMRAHARWCSKSCTAKGWRHENPGARREYMVKTLYGITAEQADVLLDSQGGVCAICLAATTGQWNVDHCHDSGAVRGVLCSPCNAGMGALGDDPDRLGRAVAYLENPPARQLVR